MFEDNHLTLRLVRLNGPEKWELSVRGLCFLFVRAGSGKYVAEPVHQLLGKGDVLVSDGLAGGAILSVGAGELAFSSFSVNVEHMFPLFSVNEIALLQNVMESFKALRHHPAGSPIAVECQRLAGDVPPQFNLDHRSHLLRVVAAVLSEEFKSLQLQRRRNGFVSIEEHLLQVFEKLSAYDLLNLSAGELAGKFGCSRRHLNRLFHQYFGYSVAALRMEMRMLKAVSLLRETDAKIINVAEQCGFNHLGLFNTCFKRRFGASPGQWRAHMMQPSADAASTATDQSPCPLQTNGLCPMLAGPDIAGTAGGRHAQLRSAALSAVLARPQTPKRANPAQNALLVRHNGQRDAAERTSSQPNL